MADLTQQVIVELIIDDSKLQPALDKLESSGEIDAKIAAGFRQTTAEINKQVVAAKADNAAIAPLKKSLGELALMAKKAGGDFEKGFAEGVTDALKEAGVSMAQFKRALGATNPGSSFDKLNKTLADTTKRVLDTSTRLEQLRRTGGAGTEAFNKLEKQLIADQRELKKLSEEFAKVKQAAEVLNGSEAENATESLRQRLKILTQQIAELKLTGEDNTEQFREMVAEAGRIKDAMADAGAEIKNIASDTRVFDNLLGSAQAVAGGFAAAQGFVGLFGDESEDLQKTLLKVNSAMAVLQGLQQIGNALQKEGAVVQLLSNRQRIITNAQLAIENGLQSSSIVVRLGAAAAQRVLNAAMAANPLLLFLSALVLVVSAMAAYISSSKEAERQTGELNAAVEEATEGFENYASQIKRESEKATSELQKNGALQSKILETQLQAESDINKRRSEEIARLREFLTKTRNADEEAIKAANDRLIQLNKDRQDADAEEIKKGNELKRQLREEDLKSQIASAQTALLKAKEGSKEQLELQKRVIALQAQEDANSAGLTEAEKTEIFTKALKEREDLQIAFEKRLIDLQLKNIETQLVNVREGSQEELNLKLQQLRLQVQAENTSTKLSEAEKKAIREKGFQDQLKLQREYNARVRAEAIQGQIDLNTVELVNVRATSEDRLLLTISNIELAAALEIDLANGNANKIKAINAKRDAEIAATTKAFIEERAQNEIDLLTANSGANNRHLQRLASDERKSLAVRITAIKQLGDFELGNIKTREEALEEEKRKRLISDEEYNRRYAQLQDDKKKVNEKTEQDITALQRAENEKRIALVFELTNNIISILDGLNKNRADRENQEIEAQRTRIQELLDAGAITEKEAQLREKRLENQQRKVQREQAERDKKIAIFSAIVNTAQAVTKTLASYPFPLNAVLAAVTAGLGAAQIAVIANRPIPKFRTGKKNQYEGPGEIGEAGAELLQKDGQMYLAKSKSVVWLGKNDKVFTPKETERMLQNSAVPGVDKEVMKWKPEKELINSEKFAATVAAAVASEIKKMPQHNFSMDEEGFKAWVQEGISRKNYMDKRYSSK